MLRSLDNVKGYRLSAQDGPIGRVRDFLFDDRHWTLRWMVADTGGWLPKRKVLISPVLLGQPDWDTRLFPVRLTRARIEDAPGIETDAPVSRAYEKAWFDRYGLSYYWGGAGAWGEAAYPSALFTREEKARDVSDSPETGDERLRSVMEVTGYHIKTTDGEIGHVDDMIVEDESWAIRYLVVDTRNWLPGRKVLVSPDWVEAFHWAERTVDVTHTREEIRESPHYDPYASVNRAYEARLYDYYGRPLYWE